MKLDRQYLLDTYGKNEEDKLLISRLCDKYQQFLRGEGRVCTRFLDSRQAALAASALKSQNVEFVLDGGADFAERKIIIFLPDWESYDDIESLRESADYPITSLKARLRGGEVPAHRDYLGALLALRIKRELIGDIFVSDIGAYILLMRESADFVSENLERAGRASLELSVARLSEVESPEDNSVLSHDTLSSLRLDGFCAAGFNLSRTDAAKYITQGSVFLNHLECLNLSKSVNEGDLVTIRGKGRIVLESVGGLSRKGRICITIRKFAR